MTTFEEFAYKVHIQLSNKYPKRTISLEKVQQVLAQTPIDQSLQQEVIVASPKKLRICQVWISGHKHKQQGNDQQTTPFSYKRVLQSGMNGWIAGNGTGKSTILKVIVWALTGVEPHFKQDIRSWIEDIAVEIAIDEQIYTIHYFPRQDQQSLVTGWVAKNGIETEPGEDASLHILTTFSNSSEMMEKVGRFFSEQMGLITLSEDFSFHSQQDAAEKMISWPIYSQVLFIGSDYTDYLFPQNNQQGKPHQKVLNTYLGVSSIATLTQLEFVRDKAAGEYRFESRRITANSQGNREKIAQLSSDLQRMEERIQAIDMGQSVLVEPTFFTTIHNNITEYTNRLVDRSLAEQQILREERDLQKEMNNAGRAVQALKEAIQFRVFLSNLIVERCPCCEQEIEADEGENEIQNKHCRLCHRELHPIQSVEHYEKLIIENTKKVDDLEHQQKAIRKDVRKIVGERKEIEDALAIWQAELKDLPRQERAGFTQEMRTLINSKGYLAGQIQQLQEQMEETHSQRLSELKDTQDILEQAVVEMQGIIWLLSASYWNELEEQTTNLAKLFGVNDLERVSFSLGAQFNLWVQQGGKINQFQHMEASERLRLKLAFHLGLLMIRATKNIGRHPGLLIIDAPGGAEMDDQHFSHILNGFSQIKEQLGDQIQLLIASTKENVISICAPDRREQLRAGETLF